jgi:hypothetical protein
MTTVTDNEIKYIFEDILSQINNYIYKNKFLYLEYYIIFNEKIDYVIDTSRDYHMYNNHNNSRTIKLNDLFEIIKIIFGDRSDRVLNKIAHKLMCKFNLYIYDDYVESYYNIFQYCKCVKLQFIYSNTDCNFNTDINSDMNTISISIDECNEFANSVLNL